MSQSTELKIRIGSLQIALHVGARSPAAAIGLALLNGEEQRTLTLYGTPALSAALVAFSHANPQLRDLISAWATDDISLYAEQPELLDELIEFSCTLTN